MSTPSNRSKLDFGWNPPSEPREAPRSPLRKPQKPLTQKVNNSSMVLERPASRGKIEADRQAQALRRKNVSSSENMMQVMTRPSNISSKTPTRLEKKRTSVDLTQEEMMRGLNLAKAEQADMEPQVEVKQVPVASPRRVAQWKKEQGDQTETIQQKRPRSPKKPINDLSHQKASRIRGNPVTWDETSWTKQRDEGRQSRQVSLKTSSSKKRWNSQMSGSVMKSALGGGDNW